MRRGSAASIGLTAPRRTLQIDVTTFLSLWLVFLFGISARQVVPGFGAIGSPALLLLLPASVWWLTARLVPTMPIDRQPRVLRKALLLHLWYLLFSFTLTRARPLTELEATGSARAIVASICLIAVALVVSDGVQSTERLRILLRRVLWGTAFMSVIGIMQFITGDELRMMLPGLTWNGEAIGGVETRSIFNRPLGTTLHPIEFSVVTASMLPIGIFLVGSEPPGPRRQWIIASVIAIGLAMPLSLSRSGIVALAVGMVVLATAWTWRQRLNALLVATISLPLLWMLVPGLVGTIRGMFTWFDEDPSIQARRSRVPRIILQFRENPWFGLGHGTWSIEDYFLLDNEFYRTALEIGTVGVLTTALIVSVTAVLAISIRYRPGASRDDAAMAHAILAAVAGIIVSVFTFDAFHYRILTGLLFLFVGTVGALFRLTAGPDTRQSGLSASPVDGP